MTNYRNGPTTDHSGVVFDYNGLLLDRVAHFGTSYGISDPNPNHITALVTGQLADTPTRGLPTRGLYISRTSQLED